MATTIERAICAVRAAETEVANVAGNMESARFLLNGANLEKRLSRRLEWAASNVKTAIWRINDALETVRELDRQADAMLAERNKS